MILNRKKVVLSTMVVGLVSLAIGYYSANEAQYVEHSGADSSSAINDVKQVEATSQRQKNAYKDSKHTIKQSEMLTPSVNTEVITKAPSSHVTSQQYQRAIEKSKQWLSDRGYFDIAEQSYSAEDDMKGEEVHVSDYSHYSAEQILSLAESGDGKAQLFRGLQVIENAPSEAEDWFIKSIVSENKTASILEIIDALALQYDAQKQSKISEPLSDREGQSIVALRNKMQSWAMLGELLGDPLPNKFLDTTFHQYIQDVDATDVKSNEKSASQMLQKIQQQRDRLGLGDPLETGDIDEESIHAIVNYIGE